MGPFVNWGSGIGERSNFKFFALGVQVGKPLTPVLHAGILSGQFELAGNIMPFWQAYTPAPHMQEFVYQGRTYIAPVGGGTFTGASITPVIFRWNFLTHSQRWQPWFQAAGGLIYTTHKYPPDILVPHGIPGGTSVWNFSPQGGGGVHYFIRPKRSIDLGVNARAHLIGIAGRQQSRRERQRSGPSRLHALEVMRSRRLQCNEFVRKGTRRIMKEPVVECVPNFSEGRDAEACRGNCCRDAR